MSTDELRKALAQLQEACAAVQRAAEALVRDFASREASADKPKDVPVPAPVPAKDELMVRAMAFKDRLASLRVDPADVSALAAAGDHRDCGRILYQILVRYFFSLPDDARAEGVKIVEDLASEAGIALPHQDVRVPSEKAEGEVVAVPAPGRRLVSAGTSSPAVRAFEEVARAFGSTSRLNGPRGAALEELMKLWPQFAGADPTKELTILRYAVNALHPTEFEDFDPVLRVFKEAGIQEMIVNPGALFDDTYSPNRYERRLVKSSQPRNTILRVLQRGFVGSDGVPLQRAVVAVSSGER